MKLNELITELQKLQAEGHGDVPVVVFEGYEDGGVGTVQWAEKTKDYFMNEKGESSYQPCIIIKS